MGHETTSTVHRFNRLAGSAVIGVAALIVLEPGAFSAEPITPVTPGLVDRLRKELLDAGAAVACPTRTRLAHQIRNPEHYELWKGRAAKARTSDAQQTMLREWVGAGKKPGIWCYSGPGQYCGAWESPPMQLSIADNMLFLKLDPDPQTKPQIQKVWEDTYQTWLSLSGAGPATSKNNLFERRRRGERSLAQKLEAHGLPTDARFYEAMGIAGFQPVWGDYWTILNPSCVTGVCFDPPSKQPPSARASAANRPPLSTALRNYSGPLLASATNAGSPQAKTSTTGMNRPTSSVVSASANRMMLMSSRAIARAQAPAAGRKP